MKQARIKQIVFFLTIVPFVLSLMAASAMAADDTETYTIFYDDGSYATIELAESSLARSNTSQCKIYTYYNSLGQKCFAYTLYADFTYNGSTSRTVSCEYAVAIYRQGWDLSTHSEYVSENTAYGRAVFTGSDGQVHTASLTLSCAPNGNVT